MSYSLFVTSLRCSRDIVMFACLVINALEHTVHTNSPFGTKGDFSCLESPTFIHTVTFCVFFVLPALDCVVGRCLSPCFFHSCALSLFTVLQSGASSNKGARFLQIFPLCFLCRFVFVLFALFPKELCPW